MIFRSNSRYSITECGSSGVKQAFLRDGTVTGDRSVLLGLERVKPEGITLENYVERNAGHLIYAD